MNKIRLLLISFLTLILFSGCIKVNTKINLNEDGSGTIEEMFLMKSSIVNMMKELALAFDSTKADEFNLFNEDELKSKAVNYGEGVEFKSGKKFSENGFEGYRVVYSFADINKIKVNPSPENKIPFGDEFEEGEAALMDENLMFNFTKGNPSTLVINFPQPKDDEKSSTQDDTSETEPQDSTFKAAEMQKAIELFDGMRISVLFNFNGNIKSTDATYVEGFEVTLLDVDFSEIIKHKEIFEELQKSKPESMEAFKQIIGDLPGIKFETKEKVTVTF